MDFGWLSLIPPIVAIVLAIVTRRVILSLAISIFVGVVIFMTHQDADRSIAAVLALHAPWSMLSEHLWIAFTEGNQGVVSVLSKSDHLRVFYFTMLFGALVGLLHAGGAVKSLVRSLSRHVKTRSSGQMTVALSGLLIFFDDYANTLLVGTTMRSTADRLKFSRDKLAYLVDSTAAPVAGLSVISTWVATEISYMSEGLVAAEGASDLTGFELFLHSLPFRFYPVFALALVFVIAWTGRDFGPMRAAECEAAEKSKGIQDADSGADEDAPGWIAIVSLTVTVMAILYVLIATGSCDALDVGVFQYWGEYIGNADPYSALIWGGLCGAIAAFGLTLDFTMKSEWTLVRGAIDGVLHLMPALAILLFAWTLTRLTGSDFLNTQGFLSDWVRDTEIAGTLIPTFVFLLAGLVAFCTGTSWGTMGLLVPLAIPVACASTADPAVLYAATGAVLAGAIFGDHCSPISDTTVLSSQASGCDHISHVSTQMPYALLAGATAILFGTLPAAFGVSPYFLIAIGTIAMIVIVWMIGKLPILPNQESSEAAKNG